MKQLFQKISVPKSTNGWLRLAAYVLPVVFLGYILYINFLPFGYDRTFVISAGVAGDKSGEFYLQDINGLTMRQTTASGTPFRLLTGSAFAIFKPTAYLRNAHATADIDSKDVVMIPPNILFNPSSVAWDYTLPAQAATTTTASTSGCVPLDGTHSTALTETKGKPGTTDSSFSLYTEWTPTSGEDGYQQIIGHGDWELIQNKEDVKFQVGSSSIKQPVDSDTFYGVKHSALAVYVPATPGATDGYINLYIDNSFSGRVYFADDTNLSGLPAAPLTVGLATAPEASYFQGCVSDVRLRTAPIDTAASHIEFTITRAKNLYPISLIRTTPLASMLTSITLHVVQK